MCWCPKWGISIACKLTISADCSSLQKVWPCFLVRKLVVVNGPYHPVTRCHLCHLEHLALFRLAHPSARMTRRSVRASLSVDPTVTRLQPHPVMICIVFTVTDYNVFGNFDMNSIAHAPSIIVLIPLSATPFCSWMNRIECNTVSFEHYHWTGTSVSLEMTRQPPGVSTMLAFVWYESGNIL